MPLVISLIVGIIFFAPFPSWYKLVGFITSATVFTYLIGNQGNGQDQYRNDMVEDDPAIDNYLGIGNCEI